MQMMKIGRPLRAVLAMAALWAATISAAAEPTLHRGLGPEPDSLSIHQAQGLSAITLLRELREGLVTFNELGEPVPGVAEAWETSTDGLTWRFRLREEANWSNGDPVTAADVVRGLHRALAGDRPARTAALLMPLANAAAVLAGEQPPSALGVSALGDHLVEIRLAQRTPWLPELLAHPVAFPLHANGVDGPDGPVNGPFVLVERVPNAVIRLARNPAYHGADAVALAAVAWYPIEDVAAELSRFRAGELDITETIPAGRLPWLRDNLPGAIRVAPYLGSFWLGINMRQSPLGDSVELRQALSLAIDRDVLTYRVLAAGEVPAWGIVPPALLGETAEWAPPTQAQREAEAQRLFAASGAPADMRVELRYNTSRVHRRMAVAVAAMWRQVLGVHTDLVNEEWAVFVNHRAQGVVTEVFRAGWIADYADAHSFLDLYRSDNELNTSFYAASAYDRLLAAAAASDGATRRAALARAHRHLLDDMPVIPLYHYVSRHLVSDRVTGYSDNVRDIHLSRWISLSPRSRE